jgi:CubicO group peptidase (beta-lactamase class C family)
MNRRRLLAVSSIAPFAPWTLARSTEKPEWQDALGSIREKYALPAIGGAIVTSAGLQGIAVTGVRKIGEEIAATVDDQWHLGSNTKAMTATLAGIAVETGKVRWDTTLGEVFTRESSLKRSPLAGATLTQLLSHWAGLPANPESWWDVTRSGGNDLKSQRASALALAANLKGRPDPGKEHLYSNWGYVLAGHLLEEVLKHPWEDLMRKGLFSPLGIEKAGFGGLGTPGEIDQPWPHGQNGKPMPENGPAIDNPPVVGPAGTAHMTLADWAKFIAEHLAGRQGRGKLLKKETYEHLHTAAQEGQPYAFGWLALERSWGGQVLNHNGSNTMNCSVAWLAPEKDFAVLACTNQGGDECQKALDAVVGVLIQEVA